MKIVNNSEKFELKFDGHDVFVSEGLSEELPQEEAFHIQATGTKWGFDVKVLASKEEEEEYLAKVEAEKNPVEPVETPEEVEAKAKAEEEAKVKAEEEAKQ